MLFSKDLIEQIHQIYDHKGKLCTMLAAKTCHPITFFFLTDKTAAYVLLGSRWNPPGGLG